EVKKIAKPWLKNDINFNKIKRNTKKFVAIFSDNDPFVSLDNAKTFRNKLNAKIIIEHNQGHFDPSSNVRKLPSALKSLLQISK
ncbi:MAG: alpha/beta hydrolase, partial [Nanoarchaeota archaeon]